MNDIANRFRSAYMSLLTYAHTMCINEISDNISFIKCYDFTQACINSHPLSYEYSCFTERDHYKASDIIDDLINYSTSDRYIAWVDLKLYYSTSSETIILVELLFSEDPVETEYHCCIPLSTDKPKGKIDLNDFVNKVALLFGNENNNEL